MKRRQAGFSSVIIIIVLLIVVLLSGIFIWRNQKASAPTKSTSTNSYADCVKAGNPVMESYPTQCSANGKTYSNPDQKVKVSSDNQSAQKYLTIDEWGVRVPLSAADNDEDLIYNYQANDTYQTVFFTFKRLVDYGICKTDIGVAMTRSKTKNDPPYNIDNPAQFAHIGEYYYSLAYGGSYCYDSENAKETAFYNSTGITTRTVADALKKLELTPTE